MLAQAIRSVMARPRLLVALTLANLFVAWLSARPLSTALAPTMDSRPAATAMIAGDDGLLAELVADHPELARVATASAQLAAVVYGILGWILAGGLLAVVALDDRRGAAALLGACGANATRMLKVGGCGLVLRLIPLIFTVGAWFAVRPLFRGRGFSELVLAVSAVALLFGVLWSAITVALDQARALALVQPELRAWRAVARGLALAWRYRGNTLKLIAFSVGGWLLVTTAYHALAAGVSHVPVWGFALLTLLRALVALGRATITTATLVAAGRFAASR